MDYKKMYEQALSRAKEIKTKISEGRILGFVDEIEEIFPELKESEDERIRKSILELVEQSSHILNPMNQKSMIAWLEKQKTVDQKFKIGDIVCRKFYEDHTIKRIYYDCDDPVYVCKNEEGLESHIPFSEQDEWELKEKNPAKTTKDTSNKVQPQPKQEWSEDDEEKFRDVIRLVEQGAPVQSIRDHYTNWLKSLKDRFQLQPKQEWSEEDNLHFKNAILAAEKEWGLDSFTAKWLKSLKFRIDGSQWRPTEEQMKSLKKSFEIIDNGFDKENIRSLYCALKHFF